MAAAIPVVLSLLASGGSMIAANQQSQNQKGETSKLAADQAKSQADLLAAAPPASSAPPAGAAPPPTNPGARGRAGTILTSPVAAPAPPPQRKTLLGL